ncbi:MAG: 7-carboxy-7-deazaguanine synthase [Gemmatimonadaceae bacterium]
MTYTVKEIFYTLQGEGFHAGRAAVFCRFSGCNLWTGREEDRHRAICQFCDTDFVGVGPDGGRFATPDELADRVAALWPAPLTPFAPHDGAATRGSSPRPQPSAPKPYVVCTGGEPLLQLDEPLIEALHARGFEVAVETNGTHPAPAGLDWICVSPKSNAPVALERADELKLVYPQAQPDAQPERWAAFPAANFFLQPMDGPDARENTRAATAYCLAHPQWRLSLQTHKILDIR